jgi:hypothetical protein
MSILNDLQLIGKALQEAGKIELYQKLLAIQEKDLEVQEENKKLRDEIEELKRVSSITGSLQFRENAYYLEKDGPFCSCCWDKERKLLRMHESVHRHHICPSCKNTTSRDKKWAL